MTCFLSVDICCVALWPLHYPDWSSSSIHTAPAAAAAVKAVMPSAEEEGKGKKARPPVTREDRERALLLHRAHLLCLLGRGLLLDAAVSDCILQVLHHAVCLHSVAQCKCGILHLHGADCPAHVTKVHCLRCLHMRLMVHPVITS